MLIIRIVLALTVSGVSAQYLSRNHFGGGSEYTYITSENTLRKTYVPYCQSGPRFRITQEGKLQELKTGQCFGLDKDKFLIRMDCTTVNAQFEVMSRRPLLFSPTVGPDYQLYCLRKKDGRYGFAYNGYTGNGAPSSIECRQELLVYGSSSEFRLGRPGTITGTPGVDECPILSSSGDLIPSFDSSAQCFNTSQRAILNLTPEGKLQYLDKSGSPRCLNETSPNRVLKGIDCNQATTLFRNRNHLTPVPVVIQPMASGTSLVANPDYGLANTPIGFAPPGQEIFSTLQLYRVVGTSDPLVFCQSRN